MKTVLLFHKFGGLPTTAWYPWLKSQLEAQGWQVIIPQLPNPENPTLESWLNAALSYYQQYQPAVLIGHSLGGTLVLKLLEKIGSQEVVKQAIMVAPPVFAKQGDKIHRTGFFTQPIDWNTLKSLKITYTIFCSSDDPAVSIDHAQMVRDQLQADYKLFVDKGHFTQEEFPELIEIIKDF